MKKQPSISVFQLWRRSLSLLFALFAMSAQAEADGGVVRIHQKAGPFIVTVFSAPSPLRAGPVDISVLVQRGEDGQPVLKGEVFVRLRSAGGISVTKRATRDAAQNKLLYSAVMNLPEPGEWELEITVEQDKGTASVLGHMTAAAPRPFLLSYWGSLSLPPVIVALFALNQALKRRAVRRKISARRNVGAFSLYSKVVAKKHSIS